MTIVGTNHFVSFVHAAQYYEGQNEDVADVWLKVANHEIEIGKPAFDPTKETLTIRDGRYHIVEN